MKFTYTKWPVTITYEVADDWFDGIDEENINPTDVEMEELKEAVNDASDYFIKAKGIILAQQEAKKHQGNEQK